MLNHPSRRVEAQQVSWSAADLRQGLYHGTYDMKMIPLLVLARVEQAHQFIESGLMEAMSLPLNLLHK